jgi:fibronectin type 3 domain-containing protein
VSRPVKGLWAAIRSVTILSLIVAGSMLAPATSQAAVSGALTRYPYLTDAVQASITINWATDTTGGTAGSVTWGPAGGDCALNSRAATRTGVTVISKAEYQWTATIPVSPDTTYCYRVLLGTTDLLGSDPSPVFTSQVAAGSTAPFSFAVFGDWGQAYTGGVNVDQTNVLQQVSVSGARFAVMTGDTAYPGGGQTEYGDLLQPGLDQSTIFGPTFWTIPGRSIPVFNVTGNHGFSNGGIQVTNWPEIQAAATSGGKYQMESYPSINGSTAKSYPSMWYAVDAGPARLYMLTTAWSDSNIGTGSVYQNDRDAHWTPGVAEYEWLKADLEAHPNALKFAFWHYPLYADSSSQPSDTFLQGGSGTLQGLLDQNNVAIVFNGHAHGYERNKPDSAGLVSYVLGNGGAALGSVSGCSAFDLYAIGAKGSHCGGAPTGLSDDHVYGFAKVTVNGHQVTVTPTDELGRTYDVQTYTFPTSEPDTIAPTAPTTVTATVVSTSKIDLAWNGATDNVAVTGYRVLRDGVQIAELAGMSYTDSTVTPDTSYSYTIEAVDAAGNVSPESAPPTVASTTGSPDGTPPTQPGSLVGSARSSSVVDLTWAASTDNVAVTGYRVFRNGVELPTPMPPDATPPTTYTDDTAAPATTYTYQVSAVDAAGNESTKASTSVTTPSAAGGGTFTFGPTDDATVDASQPTVNFGANARVTVDNSPVSNTLLKFTVATGCTISGAKLQMTIGTNTDDKSVYGGDLYRVSDTTWTESTVTYANGPASATTKTSSVATAVALNTSYLFDVTPLVTGDGPISFAIKSSSSDGARYFSSEGSATQGPQLQVTCATGGGPPPPPPPTVPGAPTSLSAHATTGAITLSWTAPAADGGAQISGYRIYRGTVSGGEQPVKDVANVTTYQDTGLTNGVTYFYRVTAVNSVGEGAASNEATATPVAASVPGAPTNLSASPGKPRGVALTWTAPASTGGSPITGYEIWRGTAAGLETKLTTMSGTGTSYKDTDAKKGVTYWYLVKAVNAVGAGPSSGEASAVAR